MVGAFVLSETLYLLAKKLKFRYYLKNFVLLVDDEIFLELSSFCKININVE